MWTILRGLAKDTSILSLTIFAILIMHNSEVILAESQLASHVYKFASIIAQAVCRVIARTMASAILTVVSTIIPKFDESSCDS